MGKPRLRLSNNVLRRLDHMKGRKWLAKHVKRQNGRCAYCGCGMNPLAPFPKRWRAADGRPLRVICGPAEGWLMVRFRGAAPWCITVPELLNASGHRFGPFTLNEPRKRT